MSTVYLVMYRLGRDEPYRVKGAFSSHSKAMEWAKGAYGLSNFNWEIESFSVDSPRSAW